MAHFDPLRWEIDLGNHTRAELDVKPLVQGKFVHEYVHYVQVLTGTVGRQILIELARLAVYAGIWRCYGWPPPAGYGQVFLRDVFEKALAADFVNSEPAQQYAQLRADLKWALADTRVRMPQGMAVGTIVGRDVLIGTHRIPDFVHVIVAHEGQSYAMPVTDRVVFENMARQVQRNYLRFNNGLDTSEVDRERAATHGDLAYICLHDTIKQLLPSSEDSAKWTIVVCQFALLCRNPGAAFAHIVERLKGLRTIELTSFLQALRRDQWFSGEFNVPPIQEVVNELIMKWGTAMLPRESWELRELAQLIANASNALDDDCFLMASPLLRWDDVRHWIARFGCPPVQCMDGRRDEIHGIRTSAPWHWYFARLNDLLAPPTDDGDNN